MTGTLPENDAPVRRPQRRAVWLAILTALLFVATAVMYYGWHRSRIGPKQPIPFSHRIHAGERQINCLFCHTTAPLAERAGVPPLETCMLCHQKIITRYPPVAELTAYYSRGEPVPWQRVNDLPEYVYFPHSVHLMRAIDCSHCHGDVRAMDRIEYVNKFEMGYCVQCHRDNQASHDCFNCHR